MLLVFVLLQKKTSKRGWIDYAKLLHLYGRLKDMKAPQVQAQSKLYRAIQEPFGERKIELQLSHI